MVRVHCRVVCSLGVGGNHSALSSLRLRGHFSHQWWSPTSLMESSRTDQRDCPFGDAVCVDLCS